jgi:8-oxo-dGTP pyrophosphatase MutT (NUDIX family)
VLIQHAESVTIVAVEGEELVVVRQHRAGSNDVTIELPSGKLETDEAPDAAVRRELAEECGLAARDWRRIGSFWAVPAYSTEYVHVYEACGIEPALEALDPDEDEEIEIGRIPVAAALDELSDAVSMAALALWQMHR